MARIPDLESLLTPALRAEGEEMMRLRGLTSTGFYGDLMTHPALFERVKALGSFLRFQGTLTARVREAAILCVAAASRNAFIWDTHQGPAREAGLDAETIAALGGGVNLPEDLVPVRELVLAVTAERSVPQELFDGLRERLGVAGAVELITLAATYAMMGRLGSAFDCAMPGAPPPPWAD